MNLCRNGHDKDVVGVTKRHCNACGRAARDRYAATPKGRAARERAVARYMSTVKRFLKDIRSERNRTPRG